VSRPGPASEATSGCRPTPPPGGPARPARPDATPNVATDASSSVDADKSGRGSRLTAVAAPACRLWWARGPRIFGIENEYGVTCTFKGQRRLSPDEVARYLFRKVVAGGAAATSSSATGPALPRRRQPPRVRHPRVRRHRRPGHARQGGGAGPRGLLVDAERRLLTRASPATSTCSRTTPTRPATPTAATRTTWSAGTASSAARRRADPVPGDPPDHLSARAR
jgi:hypothetical protein